MEKKQRKPINSDLVILACLAVVVLFFAVCTSFRSNILQSGIGKCISVSLFGKLELLGVDRAELVVYGEEIEITDPELLSQIVKETKVATHMDTNCCQDCCGCPDPHWGLNLYRGEKQVRSMVWLTCCDAMEVYKPDATHWLIPPPEVTAEAGYVDLSGELVRKLDALISAH